MTPMPELARGTILLARFPFQDSPKLPGPAFHFCLFVGAFQHGEVKVAAMAYGTSRLDEVLLEQHRGVILSVPSQHIRGAQMPSSVSHFVMDHVAVLPWVDAWVQPRFAARLDCFKQSHQADPHRRRLRLQFEQLEPVLHASALDATRDFIKTRMFGLPQGKLLRRA
jgi:hypothetical protein